MLTLQKADIAGGDYLCDTHEQPARWKKYYRDFKFNHFNISFVHDVKEALKNEDDVMPPPPSPRD
jgi:hypothetical protein